MSEPTQPGPTSVKIPADVERPDVVIAIFTARQAVILGGTALALWCVFMAARSIVPALVFLALAGFVLLVVAVMVTASRDGIGVDRLVVCGLRQALSARRRTLAPGGVPASPRFTRRAVRGRSARSVAAVDPLVEQVDQAGVLDLGRDGVTVLSSCSTVNFALRSPGEQEQLVGGFARWLNTLTGPVTISSHNNPDDLGAMVDALHDAAPSLPHPALRDAATGHADFLTELASDGALLTRTVLLAAHDGNRDGIPRLLRRAADATAHLGAAEVDVRILPGPEATEAVQSALHPPETAPRAGTIGEAG